MRSLRMKLGIGLALGVIVMWSAATAMSSFVIRHEIDEIHAYANAYFERYRLGEIDGALDYRDEAFRESVVALIAPLPLLVPLSIVLVWLIVHKSLVGVGRLREQIEMRSESDLAPLHTANVPRELEPMVTSVNALMTRLDRAIQAERNFASNSAHELRTPIAAALADTQRLIASLPDEASRARGRQLETSLQSLASLSTKLLQLARAESGLLVEDRAQDKQELIPHIIAEFEKRSDRGVRLHYQVRGPARFLTRLDPDGMSILLRNLIENALKHSPADSPVRILLDGTRNEISIINRGPLVPIDEVRTRFARGQTSAEGAGLGLSIIDAIAQGSDVNVAYGSPATELDDGVEAIISAPARSDVAVRGRPSATSRHASPAPAGRRSST